MFNREVKDLLNKFKDRDYSLHVVKANERFDQIVSMYYGNKTKAYLKIVAYLNDMIYYLFELQEGDVLKIYDIDVFVQIASQQDIDITGFIYK